MGDREHPTHAASRSKGTGSSQESSYPIGGCRESEKCGPQERGKKKKKRVPGASRGVVAREEQFSSGHWELWDPPLTPGPRGRLGLPGQRQPGGQRLHRAHLASRDTG